MKGVLSLFGEVDKQPLFKKIFAQNDIRFVCKNAETSVQLLGYVEEYLEETDAVIIDANAVLLETIYELLDEIIAKKKSLRIIVILNGGREQYLKKQLSGFRQRHIDIIFDDNGFDSEILIRFLNKGLMRQQEKPIEPVSKKIEVENADVEEISAENLFSSTEIQESGQIQETEIEDQDEDLLESFSQFRGHYSIGIMGATHGTGVTSLVVKLGQYFALHNCSVAVVDYTGTDALSLAKCKKIDCILESQSMRQLRKKYNLVVFDFGAPYAITPKGDNFSIESDYPIMNLPEFNKCSIKIVMGFADSWNVRKIRHFLDNHQWKSVIDSSFVFITAGNAHKLRRIYPDINIIDRDENITDVIYEIIKQEEAK